MSSTRHITFILLFIVVILIYFLKITWLQLDKNYKLTAENNALRRVVVYPARGLIFDRNGKLLVYNKLYYELWAEPSKIKPFDTVLLCQILDVQKELLKENLKEAEEYSKWRSSKIYGPFNEKQFLVLNEQMYKFQGFEIRKRFERTYVYNSAPLVFGYIREVDKKTVDTSKYYKAGDVIGVRGIEKTYEQFLRGKKGVRYYVVDATNKIVGRYKHGKYDTLAVAGQNIISTIDIDLQQYGEKLMTNKRGAIVAIEPSTGEVLAMVSTPSYNPNDLNTTNFKENFQKISLNPEHLLFNKALGSATSPPGSTFKVVDAAIGLSERVITTKTVIPCHGGFSIGSHIVKCHHNAPIDFYYSIAGSCNTYYCEVFTRLIRNKKYGSYEDAYRSWTKQLNKFGIGVKLGIDLPEESRGVLYSADKFNELYGKGKWGPFRIISLAIGQGQLGLTPLQLANIAAIMANRGYYITPHVVKKIDGQDSIPAKYRQKHYTGIDTTYISAVVDGMEQVVTHGTAAGIRLDSITQCGKTGTAQNPHGDYNSVFIEFAPKYNPKIAIAVYVENGGYGAVTAAPIASLMVEKYLTDTITRPWLEEAIINKNLMNRGHRTDKP